MLCRVQRPLHSANITDLPSVTGKALGKGRLFAECLTGGTRHSGHLCRVSESTALGKAATFAECLTLTLGKAPSRWRSSSRPLFFAECRIGTRQSLCRVSDKVHSTKRSLPINCLPSALCRVYIGLCRVPEALGKEAKSGSDSNVGTKSSNVYRANGA